MKDISNISNISENDKQENISNLSKISKGNNILNSTKLSNGSYEFKELNKEIFKIIQDGGNISGINNNNNNNNLSQSSNNASNSFLSFNDINWKKNTHENSSLLTGNNSALSNLSNIIPKRQIEVLNMKNTFDEKDLNNNINYPNNNYKNKNYNKFSMIPEDTQIQEDFMENRIHFTNVQKINKNGSKRFNDNNNDISNNLILNYNQTNLISMNNSNVNQIGNKNKNFIPKTNYQMMLNNTNQNNNISNNFNNINDNNNIINNNINDNNNPNNIINTNQQQYMYFQNQLPQNNYFYQNANTLNPINQINQINPLFFPENAFSYNNSPINPQKQNKQNKQKNSNNNNNINNQNNILNKNNNDNNNNKKTKNKKKFKDKIEQKLFIIDIDNIIKGTDERTTIMIRHIPNKYTSQALLEELNTICKSKYDFFYLPLDAENECNLGYAFINFVHPLHIVHFYNIFKARKWNLYKSNKECDLSFAKFQGKAELTANLDKNMNKIEDKKKLPMVFETITSAKIDLEKKYFNEIKNYQEDIMKNINWI